MGINKLFKPIFSRKILVFYYNNRQRNNINIFKRRMILITKLLLL